MLREDIPFTVSAAFAIRDAFFPGTPIDYLLASDGDVLSEREKDMAQLDALEEILDEIDADPVLYESLEAMCSEVLSGKSEAS